MIAALGWAVPAWGATPGTIGGDSDHPLVIAENGKSEVIICVSPDAGQETGQKTRRGEPIVNRQWERHAADDLAKFIEMMSGARPLIADTPQAIEAALRSNAPLLIVGELALREAPELREALDAVAKDDPVLRADAIALRRDGNRVYLAGTNDDSHYFAVTALLKRWGCRWYMPTPFGQCIPVHETLKIGELDYAYAPPFEVRMYWLSWNASEEDYQAFMHRNFMSWERVPSAHALSRYIRDLVPEGGSVFNVPISDPTTAQHVVEQVASKYAAGKSFSLSINDGVYRSDYPRDQELKAGIFDKYFVMPSMTEPFMVFYNNVANTLQSRYPESDAKIGFLAYNNITIPPQRKVVAADSLVAYLAPIDIDSIHGMDSPLSPPRQEFRQMMYRWAQVMQGRVVIYDYDQGMLVWRDIPNPSHQAFAQDVKHYREAGVLGISTESRGAMATTFTNLYLRGQLMWNPDADVSAMLDEFYPTFYGPAAKPMRRYWQAIFDAWANTLVTEHEYFIAPAIYTPSLMTELARYVDQADRAIAPLKVMPADELSRRQTMYVQRMEALDLQWAVLNGYMQMVYAAATDADYDRAAKLGKAALAARLKLAEMNPTFTSQVIGAYAKEQDPLKQPSPAWFPGEVGQYIRLSWLTGGKEGRLVKKLPLKWAFRRDPHDTGLMRGWARRPIDLTYWKQHGQDVSPRERKNYPAAEWGMIRTDLYTQPQGIRFPDRQTFNGYMWYRTDFELSQAEAAAALHVKFPGLFGETWLYVNGYLVAYRPQEPMWWQNDYHFDWDANLADHVQPGRNTMTLRVYVPHHVGGMFRRPFLYRPVPDGVE